MNESVTWHDNFFSVCVFVTLLLSRLSSAQHRFHLLSHAYWLRNNNHIFGHTRKPTLAWLSHGWLGVGYGAKGQNLKPMTHTRKLVCVCLAHHHDCGPPEKIGTQVPYSPENLDPNHGDWCLCVIWIIQQTHHTHHAIKPHDAQIGAVSLSYRIKKLCNMV